MNLLASFHVGPEASPAVSFYFMARTRMPNMYLHGMENVSSTWLTSGMQEYPNYQLSDVVLTQSQNQSA